MTDSKPVEWYVEEQVARGKWRVETIPAAVVGLPRDVTVFRARRKDHRIMHAWHGDKDTFCPPIWWDLAIGSGACSMTCRACFLMLTHRIRRDPWRHLLYDNIDDFERDAEKWLLEPGRKPFHTLGVGIDRSDSLLYEGVTGLVRRLSLLFGDHERNPRNTKLVLLTKSKNTLYLADVPPAYRCNTVVTFSLNPEPVADLWEGKYPDGVRITPPISQRLQAARFAANIGYEIRVRLDPILTPDGWQEMYREFVADIKAMRINFRYWTLGTYREKNNQLDTWREKWGLLPMEWQPGDEELVKDGTHFHMPVERRMEIYRTVRDIIHAEFPGALVSLCKETHGVRQGVGLCNADCNCLR